MRDACLPRRPPPPPRHVRRRVNGKQAPPEGFFGDQRLDPVLALDSKLQCPTCFKLCTGVNGLTTHRVKCHGYVALETQYAEGSRCLSCRRDFGNRTRLIAHLQGQKSLGTRCFFELVLPGCPKHTPEKLEDLRRVDTAIIRALKKRGRGIKTAATAVLEYAGPIRAPLQGPLPFGTVRADELIIFQARDVI